MNACRRVAALSLVIAGFAIPSAADASADVSRIEPVWHAAGPTDGRHAVADETGVVMTGGSGDVRAVGANGAPQWQVSIAQPGEYVDAAPSLGSGLVVVPVNEQRVVALDRSTGTQRWQQPAAGVLAASVGEGPFGPLVLMVAPTEVRVVSATDGAPAWSAALDIKDDVITGTARAWVAAGRVVVVWGDDRTSFRAFDLSSGLLTWSLDVMKWGTLPTLAANALYFVVNKRIHGHHVVGQARSVDVATGATRWSRRLTGQFLPTFRTEVDGSTMVVVGLMGQVTALRTTDGAVVWRRRTFRKQLANAPRIVGPVVAFTTYGTGLIALAVSDGDVVSNSIPGRAETFAIIDDSAKADGQLYLLVRRSGAVEGEVWMLQPQGS